MAAYISPDGFRVHGEKAALFWGAAIFACILLLFTGGVSNGFYIFIILGAITAVSVWIQQGQLIGGATKVSEKQFPDIHNIAREAASRLGMNQPEVFIRQDPNLNAFAIGFLGKKSVVLHSATVEAMEKSELQYIIGHEFAHIKCGHTNLIVLQSPSKVVKVWIISSIIQLIFLLWSRKAEYTCDRGGLIANRDPKAAVAAICKLAVGPALFQQMSIDDFANQQMDLDQNDIARLSENLATHPYLVKRIYAIQQYFESEDYKRLISKSNPPTST